MKKISILALLCSAVLLCSCADSEERAAARLTKRLIPQFASNFEYVHTAAAADVFTVESKGDKIVIGGNTANSMAVGLNWYLKNYCLTTVSWQEADPIDMPKVLPTVEEPVRIEALVQDRFFLNYCTYGYSMPWWSWKQWEHFIDWMALNGVTMPLNITGQEAVWQKVWRSFGLTDEQIRAFFTGPAVLPWHRMMNMDRWLGPLPQKWIDRQAKLQKKILARERELSMTPVLSAFSGHVPREFAELNPDAIIHPVSLWDGFEEDFRCSILHPDDPLFAEVQARFLKEQEKMYGTDHIYGLDIFNEVDFFEGREWDPEELARISSKVYSTLEAVDPNAVWLQMGWMMYYDAKHWTPANIEAYLSSVPQGKIIMLDYFCEKEMIWKYTDAFYGQPYYFCFLGNFGGNTNLSGDFHNVSARISETLAGGGQGLLGLGCTLEGFGVSQFLYEYTLERAWNTGVSDCKWIENLADRHVGRKDPVIEDAFAQLVDSIYVITTYSGICPVPALHPCLEGDWFWTTISEVPYSFDQIAGVWKTLLSSPSDNDFYKFDIVNIGSEVLKLAFVPVREAIASDFRARDAEALHADIEQMRHLYDLWENILACHDAFSFKNWVEDARAWGDTPEEKDYYERSARVIVTSWGGTGQLTDYANRQWSGLVSGYYRARWEMFFSELEADLAGGPAFDQKAFDDRCREFELSFGYPECKINWTTPGNALEVAQSIAEELGII